MTKLYLVIITIDVDDDRSDIYRFISVGCDQNEATDKIGEIFDTRSASKITAQFIYNLPCGYNNSNTFKDMKGAIDNGASSEHPVHRMRG